MPAYVIAQLEIKDPAAYQNYLDGFMPSFMRHGGELLATSRNETEVLEGTWALPGTVPGWVADVHTMFIVTRYCALFGAGGSRRTAGAPSAAGPDTAGVAASTGVNVISATPAAITTPFAYDLLRRM